MKNGISWHCSSYHWMADYDDGGLTMIKDRYGIGYFNNCVAIGLTSFEGFVGVYSEKRCMLVGKNKNKFGQQEIAFHPTTQFKIIGVRVSLDKA